MTSRLPSVHVVGTAEREVVPDRVVVDVLIRTPVLATPAEALTEGVARRGRVRQALAAGAPDATISDARVTTREEVERVEEVDPRGRSTTRTVVRGHSGLCELRAEAEAGRAAALMGIVGTHPEVHAARPRFTIGRGLRRAVDRELEQDAVRDGLERGRALAGAAGMGCGEVLAIGEPPSERAADEPPYGRHAVFAVEARADGAELEEEFGELVPEPVTISAAVPVSLALLPRG